MKRVLGAAALVASCMFAQDVFAQRGGFRGFHEGGFRAAAPGMLAVSRVVVRPGLRFPIPAGLPYVPVGTPPFFLAGHDGGKSCWGWDGYQWLNFCGGVYPGF
jgi:hypothetical protein